MNKDSKTISILSKNTIMKFILLFVLTNNIVTPQVYNTFTSNGNIPHQNTKIFLNTNGNKTSKNSMASAQSTQKPEFMKKPSNLLASVLYKKIHERKELDKKKYDPCKFVDWLNKIEKRIKNEKKRELLRIKKEIMDHYKLRLEKCFGNQNKNFKDIINTINQFATKPINNSQQIQPDIEKKTKITSQNIRFEEPKETLRDKITSNAPNKSTKTTRVQKYITKTIYKPLYPSIKPHSVFIDDISFSRISTLSLFVPQDLIVETEYPSISYITTTISHIITDEPYTTYLTMNEPDYEEAYYSLLNKLKKSNRKKRMKFSEILEKSFFKNQNDKIDTDQFTEPLYKLVTVTEEKIITPKKTTFFIENMPREYTTHTEILTVTPYQTTTMKYGKGKIKGSNAGSHLKNLKHKNKQNIQKLAQQAIRYRNNKSKDSKIYTYNDTPTDSYNSHSEFSILNSRYSIKESISSVGSSFSRSISSQISINEKQNPMNLSSLNIECKRNNPSTSNFKFSSIVNEKISKDIISTSDISNSASNKRTSNESSDQKITKAVDLLKRLGDIVTYITQPIICEQNSKDYTSSIKIETVFDDTMKNLPNQESLIILSREKVSSVFLSSKSNFKEHSNEENTDSSTIINSDIANQSIISTSIVTIKFIENDSRNPGHIDNSLKRTIDFSYGSSITDKDAENLTILDLKTRSSTNNTFFPVNPFENSIIKEIKRYGEKIDDTVRAFNNVADNNQKRFEKIEKNVFDEKKLVNDIVKNVKSIESKIDNKNPQTLELFELIDKTKDNNVEDNKNVINIDKNNQPEIEKSKEQKYISSMITNKDYENKANKKLIYSSIKSNAKKEDLIKNQTLFEEKKSFDKIISNDQCTFLTSNLNTHISMNNENKTDGPKPNKEINSHKKARKRGIKNSKIINDDAFKYNKNGINSILSLLSSMNKIKNTPSSLIFEETITVTTTKKKIENETSTIVKVVTDLQFKKNEKGFFEKIIDKGHEILNNLQGNGDDKKINSTVSNRLLKTLEYESRSFESINNQNTFNTQSETIEKIKGLIDQSNNEYKTSITKIENHMTTSNVSAIIQSQPQINNSSYNEKILISNSYDNIKTKDDGSTCIAINEYLSSNKQGSDSKEDKISTYTTTIFAEFIASVNPTMVENKSSSLITESFNPITILSSNENREAYKTLSQENDKNKELESIDTKKRDPSNFLTIDFADILNILHDRYNNLSRNAGEINNLISNYVQKTAEENSLSIMDKKETEVLPRTRDTGINKNRTYDLYETKSNSKICELVESRPFNSTQINENEYLISNSVDSLCNSVFMTNQKTEYFKTQNIFEIADRANKSIIKDTSYLPEYVLSTFIKTSTFTQFQTIEKTISFLEGNDKTCSKYEKEVKSVIDKYLQNEILDSNKTESSNEENITTQINNIIRNGSMKKEIELGIDNPLKKNKYELKENSINDKVFTETTNKMTSTSNYEAMENDESTTNTKLEEIASKKTFDLFSTSSSSSEFHPESLADSKSIPTEKSSFTLTKILENRGVASDIRLISNTESTLTEKKSMKFTNNDNKSNSFGIEKYNNDQIVIGSSLPTSLNSNYETKNSYDVIKVVNDWTSVCSNENLSKTLLKNQMKNDGCTKDTLKSSILSSSSANIIGSTADDINDKTISAINLVGVSQYESNSAVIEIELIPTSYIQSCSLNFNDIPKHKKTVYQTHTVYLGNNN